MRKLFTRICYFSLPFVVIFIFVLAVDPYNFIFHSNFIDNKTKSFASMRSDAVMPRGMMFWKINAYRRNPSNYIIIGDSRGASLDTVLINNITGQQYFNFAIAGANYQTNISIFWHVAKNKSIKEIYWQVGFPHYNKAEQSYDLFQKVYHYFENSHKYFFKNWFWFDSFFALYYHIFSIQMEKSLMTYEERMVLRDKNWPEIIRRQGVWKMFNYNYPSETYHELKEISAYCSANSIDLTFIIFPNHPELYKLISQFDLDDARVLFKQDIKKLGKTYDYSFDNIFTSDSSLFFDLYHAKQCVSDSVAFDVFTDTDPEIISEKYKKHKGVGMLE